MRLFRSFSSTIQKQTQPKKAIVMFNLGGPTNLQEVEPFLFRLFSDPDLIPIPFQKTLAPWIAKRRTPKIQNQYSEIGGGSPILKWTQRQGALLEDYLNQNLSEHGPYKTYIAFRYAPPLLKDTLEQMKEDKVERAIAFTQYPQYSCSTTGSSFNELAKMISSNPQYNFKWSLIDRWPTHSGLVDAFAELIKEKLKKFPIEVQNDVVLVFSAHSLPMTVVNRGDNYPIEVAATVNAVMQKLGFQNPYKLAWQSQVGPQPWLGPKTDVVLEGLAKNGHEYAMMIPIAFTSDHIETLFELDLEYGKVGKEAGLKQLERCDSLNDHPLFIKAMGELVMNHLKDPKHTTQFELRCPTCRKESCQLTRKVFCN